MDKVFYLKTLKTKLFIIFNLSFCLILVLTENTHAQRFYSVVFNQLPQDYQLYPRDLHNESNVPLSGFIEVPDFRYMSVQVFRNNKLVKYLKAPISYDNIGKGYFATETKIKAELAEYSFKVFACKTTDSTLMVTREKIVSGDVYILTGQSNSTGFFTESDTNEFCRTFGKITGNLNTDVYNPADTLWAISNQQYLTDVGTMGFELQKQLSQTYGIPNCLISAGFHWSSAAMHAQRTENNPADLTNGYGRMLYRIQKGGLVNAAKTFIFRQGETEAYHEGADWPGNFSKLRNNLKLDLPNLERLYVFQIDVIYYQSLTGALIRDYQRRLPEIYPDVQVLATVGTQQFDGLHYGREGNRQSGLELSRLIAKDSYGLKDTVDINSPAIKKVFYKSADKKQLILTFNEGQELVYPDRYKPNDQVALDMKDFFYLDNKAGNILSGKAENNRIVLELEGAKTAAMLNYLPPFIAEGGSFYPYSGPYLTNKRGMRALTFYNVPILDALATPNLTAAIDNMANVSLSWNAVNNTIEYDLERKLSNETRYQKIALLGSASANYKDDLRTESGLISYRLKAIGTSAESGDYGYAEVEAPIVLGVSMEPEALFSVFPNPALRNDRVNLRFKNPLSGILTVINSAGQIVTGQVLNHQIEADFMLPNLPPAKYYIQIKSDDKLYVRKLLLH